MEQKRSSIQTEVNETKTLFTGIIHDPLNNFLNNPETMALAAEISFHIIQIQDKLTRLSQLYSLCQDDAPIIKLQSQLSANRNQIKAILEKKPLAIQLLQKAIADFFSLIVQICLQLEITVIYQSMDDPSTHSSFLNGKDFSIASATIKTILEKTIEMIGLSIPLHQESEFDLLAQNNTQKIFELFDEINKTITYLNVLCQKNSPDCARVIFCVVEISKIMRSYNEPIEININSLVKLFKILKRILLSLEKRLKPHDNLTHRRVIIGEEKKVIVGRKLFFEDKPVIELPLISFIDFIDEHDYLPNNTDITFEILEAKLILLNKKVIEQARQIEQQIEFLTEEEIINIAGKNSVFFEIYDKAITKIKKISAIISNDYLNEPKIKKDFCFIIAELSQAQIDLEIVNPIKNVIAWLEKTEKDLIPNSKNLTVKQPQKKPLTFSIQSKKPEENSDIFKKLNASLFDFTSVHDKLLEKPITVKHLGTLPEIEQEIAYSLQEDFCASCKNIKQMIEQLNSLWDKFPPVTQEGLINDANKWCEALAHHIIIIEKIEQWSTPLVNWLKGEIIFSENFLTRLRVSYETLTAKTNQTSLIQLDQTAKIHCFKFFDCIDQNKNMAFYAISRNETNFKHLAHFYLICKNWSVSSSLVNNLPQWHVNFILWWVLRLTTEEEKNRLYSGRSGGLAVTTDPLPCEITVNEYENNTKIKKFFTVRRIVTIPSTVDATGSTVPSLPEQSPSITDQHESCPPRQNF